MASFWLATFELNPQAKSGPTAHPAGWWAIEVIREEHEFAVLLSTVDHPTAPTRLECRVGFANGCNRCDLWRGRGFRLQDAEIRLDGDVLRVLSAGFLANPVIDYAAELLTIAPAIHPGSEKVKSAPKAKGPLDVVYSQSQIAPDFAAPATRVRQMPVSWKADRDDLRKLAPFEMKIGLEKARLPSLAMFPTGSQKPIAFWTGSLRLPSWPPEKARKDQRKGPGQVQRPRARSFDRADYFVGSSFRFEEVEVLGFRIDLDRQGIETVEDSVESAGHRRTERIDDLIEEMIEPLNFHHGPRHVSHFRYRPATRTVSLELLRYGRMRLKKEWQDLTVDDVQSQHELLIRVLVGRVDDDTGQAHDPATYVPTLFVDNPWSKALGREVQGFDKRLADFCIEEKDQLIVLRPDGRRQDRPEANPVPLTRITEVRMTRSIGTSPSDLKILELDYPFDRETDDDFDEIDLDLALGTSSFAPTRWRQSDFGDMEFRRSFAREAIPKTFGGIRSVQVSPIGEPRLLRAWQSEITWITGTFALDGGARIARPNGTVGLTLRAEPSAPRPWRQLCSLVGIPKDGSARLSFPAGSWYRMRCSMDLDIDNGLE